MTRRLIPWATAAIAAGCSGGMGGAPHGEAPFKPGTELTYAITAGGNVTFRFEGGEGKPLRLGWIDEDAGGLAGGVRVDAYGRSEKGGYARPSHVMGGAPTAWLWLPPTKRATGAELWTIGDPEEADGFFGGGGEEPKPVTVTGEEDWDGRPCWEAVFQHKSAIQADQFRIRALYDKGTGLLVRYEYAPFLGGGSGWTLLTTNVEGW